jgi:hypothetical protein
LSAGRPSLINLQDPNTAERFRKIAQDVKAGKLPIQIAADQFGVSTKSIRRAIDNMRTKDEMVQTYAKLDKWEQLYRIDRSGAAVPISVFEEWAVSRGRTFQSKSSQRFAINCLKRVWEECWGRKNLTLLTEEDMIHFVSWVDNLTTSEATGSKPMTPDGKRSYVNAVRLLMRFGFGDPSWLNRFLSTKGRKSDPRMPPELKTIEVFRTVMPKLYNALDQLLHKQTITLEEYETQRLVLRLKSTLQARTGSRKNGEQREVWGTMINNPSNAGSSLLLSPEGKVSLWTVKCKGRETWEIPRAMFECQPNLCEEVEDYVKLRGLKTGDYLIQMEIKRSLDILKLQAQIAGFSALELHDLRKVSATTLADAGWRIEEIANYGVGWISWETLAKHYVAIKGLHMGEAYAKLRQYNLQGAPVA